MVRDSLQSSQANAAPKDLAPPARIAVIGGGVIGLSIAWRLGRTGAHVTLFDAGHVGMGGSWAAAGMLAASVESHALSPALRRFCQWSAELWPAFARDLEEASGAQIGFLSSGTLLLSDKVQVPPELAPLRAAQLREKEPHLAPHIEQAYFFPQDHSVDSRILLSALSKACRNTGVVVKDNTRVERLETSRNSVTKVETQQGALPFDAVCLAAGAWSKDLLLASDLGPLPIAPIKGQMLCLQMDVAAPLVRHVLWGDGIYLVPRADGRLIIGATMEDAGFDVTTTTEAITRLRLGAEALVPGLNTLPVVETWAGLRAGSPDQAPCLGMHGAKNLYVAMGHHRNGVLQAPATAEALAGLMENGQLPEAARAFVPARFA